VLREARRQLSSQTLWFQRWQSRWLFTARRTSARTLAELARRAGIDQAALAETVAVNNAAAPDSGRDVAGKPMELVRPLVTAPFSLIDVSLRAAPAPMLTLGGLTVDEETGLVLTPTGAPIPGLYAAGRTAVGICSGSYVSGLSLADCVFSGRRAGRHAATADPAPDPAPDPAAPATAIVASAGSAAGAVSESGEEHDRRD
jgi:3-oxo-5alpha-steroid 4-dehydrogenase